VASGAMSVDPRREWSVAEPLPSVEEKVFAAVRGAVDEGVLAAQPCKQVLVGGTPGVEHNRVEVRGACTDVGIRVLRPPVLDPPRRSGRILEINTWEWRLPARKAGKDGDAAGSVFERSGEHSAGRPSTGLVPLK
jgi:hypothetical protein